MTLTGEDSILEGKGTVAKAVLSVVLITAIVLFALATWNSILWVFPSLTDRAGVMVIYDTLAYGFAGFILLGVAVGIDRLVS